MWKAVGSSVVGSSHERHNLPCQDHSDYVAAELGSEKVMLIALADGAGSAKASDLGARVAVEQILQAMRQTDLHILEINEHTASGWIAGVRARLEEVAAREGLEVKDLACTLLFAILGGSRSVFAQIGDGAWIAQTAQGYEPITWPRGGEYANQTTFVTSPDWQEALQFKSVPDFLQSVAGLTDGLQNVALHFASRSVHVPFFQSKFEALRNTHDATQLRAPLTAFLSSAGLVARTDDDKTLVLACRRDVKFLCGPDEAAGAEAVVTAAAIETMAS